MNTFGAWQVALKSHSLIVAMIQCTSDIGFIGRVDRGRGISQSPTSTANLFGGKFKAALYFVW